MLGLALELQRRGNDVLFATNAHYLPIAQSEGLECEPLGTEQDFQNCIRHPDLWHPFRSFRYLYQSLQPMLQRQYDLHVERRQRGPLIGITNCLGMGAFVARDRWHLPVITLHVQPAVLWSDVQPPKLPGFAGPRWMRRALHRMGERFVIDATVCPSLNRWRHELGLGSVSKISRWWNSPSGVLCMFPSWYSEPQTDWPAGWMQTDFPLWNHRSDEGMPDAVASFLAGGDKPLVFTPGSANIHGRDFFQAALEACRILKRRGIFLTEFPDQVPKDLPDSLMHARYVPLDLLLQHAAAFIHHGGIGSTSQAMHAGIPQIIVPWAHDQFDNAERICKLHIGETLSVRALTGSQLARALDPLLRSDLTRSACQTIARRMADRTGISRSADALMSLVSSTDT